jgi:hypothetical protein
VVFADTLEEAMAQVVERGLVGGWEYLETSVPLLKDYRNIYTRWSAQWSRMNCPYRWTSLRLSHHTLSPAQASPYTMTGTTTLLLWIQDVCAAGGLEGQT